MAQNKKKKNQSTETDQGMTQIINLEEKSIKTEFCYILCVQAAGRASISKDMENIFFKPKKNFSRWKL